MSTPQAVLSQLKSLPLKPGVYQFRDKHGTLLYVGKANKLKNRVSQYFQNRSQLSPRIQSMVSQIADIQPIVTASELEALVLEANLIKTYRPKYNILMKDDKKYPWLVLTDDPYPRLEYRRGPSSRGRSFGPYVSPGAVYETLKLIKKIFPLRQRRKPLFKDRPCMNYAIGTCPGPCQQLISPEAYQHLVKQVVLFLKGQADDLLDSLHQDMTAASEALQFEKAAALRDRIAAVEHVISTQRVMSADSSLDQDVIGMVTADGSATMAVLRIRKGKLIQTHYFTVDLPSEAEEADVYQAFCFQYYEGTADHSELPKSLVLQHHFEAENALCDWLSQLRGSRVKAQFPQRSSQAAEVLAMASQNAKEAFERNQLEQAHRLKLDPSQALLTLQTRLGLPDVPRRIECYDISHLSGTHQVASMVVFTDGLPDKREYRHFKLKTVEEGTPDDFQSMREVMSRRFGTREHRNWPEPDLVIIDGGKGQLSAALEGLAAIGVDDQPIVSLAKKFEEVFLPGKSQPVVLERDSMALFLLQQIRDEAHRFAITHNRNLRRKAQTQSVLDSIKGLGPKRRTTLLKTFGSGKAVLKASLSELAQALGLSQQAAEPIYQQLQAAQNQKTP